MLPNSRPLLIGITGNIGSGKSTFCQLLTDSGLSVYYADTIANQRLEDPIVLTALINRYSPSILLNEQPPLHIDRSKLAGIVFSNSEELAFLNSIIHTLVLKDMQEIVDTCDEAVLCFEVPLLFEAGLQDCFDFVVLVSAPYEVRLSRLLERGETTAGATRRMANQMDDAAKVDQVDLHVLNTGTQEELQKAASSLVFAIDRLPFRHVKPFAD